MSDSKLKFVEIGHAWRQSADEDGRMAGDVESFAVSSVHITVECLGFINFVYLFVCLFHCLTSS